MRRSREEETSEEEENERRQWEEKVGEAAASGVSAEKGEGEKTAKKRRKAPEEGRKKGVYGRGQQARRGVRFGPWPGQGSARGATTEPETTPIRPSPGGASSSATRVKTEEKFEVGRSGGASSRQPSEVVTGTVPPTRASESLVERWAPATVEFEREDGSRVMVRGVALRSDPRHEGQHSRSWRG